MHGHSWTNVQSKTVDATCMQLPIYWPGPKYCPWHIAVRSREERWWCCFQVRSDRLRKFMWSWSLALQQVITGESERDLSCRQRAVRCAVCAVYWRVLGGISAGAIDARRGTTDHWRSANVRPYARTVTVLMPTRPLSQTDERRSSYYIHSSPFRVLTWDNGLQ